MLSSDQKMTELIVVNCIVLILLVQSGLSSYLALSPPEQEWERSPDIFLSWPKVGMDQTKSSVKSPTVSTIHEYLPGTTKPIKYLLKMLMMLESDIESEELKAPGSVRILTKCVQSTYEIILHVNTKYVTILEDSVKVFETVLGKPGRQISVTNQTFDMDTDFYIIRLGSPCKVQKEYIVDIHFVAEIASDTLSGLYLSTYLDPSTNITKRLATTQLEAEHARQMFPNYDQPDHKATFSLIIGRHANYSSMSNMNMIKTEADNDRTNWYWDHYAPTPVMSSYLVAVVVSDFTCEQAPPSAYKKHVETCGPTHMIQRGGGIHAASVVANVLKFYDSFMKQEYPLPKMTSVAIPDFQAGAMENWGLNTYRVKGLIYYPNITSEDYRFRIDLTIAHELAHQNWGNLVTTKLWNQIWLNEGFATYISYFGLKSSSPEFDPDKQWISYRRRALQIDGSIKSHPLVNASSPMFYFDGISYSKGASLLKMMEKFLSPKVFHESLRLYLAKYAYNTATQWDLFDVIERHAISSGVNPNIASLTEIMESWTLQPGFPLIRVEYMTNRAVLVTQERFIDTPQENNFPSTFWYIPITIIHNNLKKSVPTVWLSAQEPSKVIYTEEDFKYLVVNPDASAFARVLYDGFAAALIENQLNTAHEVISAVTRAQIIEDSFEAAWAGYGRIEAALNYTRYLSNELEPVVWSSALAGLGKIYTMFADDEIAISLFKKYISDRITASLLKIGVEQSSAEIGISVLHRGSLLHWAGLLEIPEALTHAVGKVQNWVDSSVNSIPSDLHSQTYCNAIIGNKKMYEHLLDLFSQETDVDVKQAITRSLGCSKDETVLNELRLNLTQEDFVVSPAYSFELMFKLARNGLMRRNVLQYFDEHFYAIQYRFEGVYVIAKSLEIASQYWNTKEQLEKVQHFLTKYAEDLEDVVKISKRIIQNIQRNILWMERFSSPVKTWLTNN